MDEKVAKNVLYKICKMLFLFCPQMSPFELNDPERFLLHCQKIIFTRNFLQISGHFLSSKENSKEQQTYCTSITNFQSLSYARLRNHKKKEVISRKIREQAIKFPYRVGNTVVILTSCTVPHLKMNTQLVFVYLNCIFKKGN